MTDGSAPRAADLKSVTIDALVLHLEPSITPDQVVTRHDAEIIGNMAVAVISVKLQEVTSPADFANLDEPLYRLISSAPSLVASVGRRSGAGTA